MNGKSKGQAIGIYAPNKWAFDYFLVAIVATRKPVTAAAAQKSITRLNLGRVCDAYDRRDPGFPSLCPNFRYFLENQLFRLARYLH
jgi:hypothetical protein